MVIYTAIFLRKINFLNKSYRENKNKHFTFKNFFFRKSCRVSDYVENCCTARQATEDNMPHVHWMLDT